MNGNFGKSVKVHQTFIEVQGNKREIQFQPIRTNHIIRLRNIIIRKTKIILYNIDNLSLII